MHLEDVNMQHEHAHNPSRPRTESGGAPSNPFRSGESIAVVGMACRFPGAGDLSAFWRLLEAGGNAVTHGSPGEREGRVGEMFPDVVPVHDASRFGAFLPGIDRFDAEFFRISPLEAASLDPQQRLLLELSWEALEDAGIAPDRLVGSRSGVYVGIGSYEYQEIVHGDGVATGPDTPLYLVTGNRFSTASGRVSFVLGLEGPSIAVDTACSSSLVAVHHAVAGLDRREADLAIAGGVCVILSPLTTEAFANAGMLSPTGQCWTFDERADGFVRSEGCGMLVLRRLSDAEAAGDRIWGVIRGSAVNQDGERPGLPAPKELTPGAGHRGGACPGRGLAVAGGLPRSARHRDEAGRSDRGERRGGGLRPGPRAGAPAPHGLGEDEHRPPGRRRRCGGSHQGAPRDAGGPHPEAPQPPKSQPRDRLGPPAGTGHHGVDGLAARCRPPAARGGELVRFLRHQLARHRGGLRRAGPRAGERRDARARGRGKARLRIPAGRGPGPFAGRGGASPPRGPDPAALGEVGGSAPGACGPVRRVARRTRRRHLPRRQRHFPRGRRRHPGARRPRLDGERRAEPLRPARGRRVPGRRVAA